MAIVPSTDYSGQTETGDSGYPHGKAKNVTVSGDGTGTPLERNWVNDIWGFLQAVLDRAGITPSGSPDEVGTSDYMDAFDQRFGTDVDFSVRVYDIASTIDTGKRFDISGESASVDGLTFSNAGAKMYIVEADEAWGYDLTVPFDISTAAFDTGNTKDFVGGNMNDLWV